MNNELMEQCRREAEEWAVSEVGKKLKLNTVDERVREIIIERNDQSIQGYAAALYAERSKQRELTDEASHHLFMGWLHANHADINDNADVSDLCRRAFLDALRYARDNGYLAPATGLTVERAYDVWRSFHFRHQKDGEQYMDYLEARNAAYRARLTEEAKH